MSSRPVAYVSRRAAKRWHSGHPWIYRSDVRRVDAETGDCVRVISEKNKPLGWAFYSKNSEITLRRVSNEKAEPDKLLWLERFEAAAQRRESWYGDYHAYRLIFGEADGLPATVVDRFDDVFVLQTPHPSSERYKSLLVDWLKQKYHPKAIVERNDGKARMFEGLEQVKSVLFGEIPETVSISLGDVNVLIDPLEGQKTGAFLDQGTTLQRSMELAMGAERILDAFCYQGWFACAAAAAQPEAKVTAVDISGAAIEAVKKNLALNKMENAVKCVEANLFDWLRDQSKAKARYDLIFLDPPSFIKSRGAKQAGLRGYKEVNLRALKLLEPGGFLVTSSCSYHLDRPAFWQLVQEAASDQNIEVNLIDIWGQGPDHPRLSNFPESDYLKSLVLQRVS